MAAPFVAMQFRVRGRVQGVGFRAAAQRRATGLGLAGWVRNEPDGAVCGLAAGPVEALATFRDWLAQGSPSAVVSAVDWEPSAERIAPYEGFLVRR